MFRWVRLGVLGVLGVALMAFWGCTDIVGEGTDEANPTLALEPAYSTQRIQAPIEQAELVFEDSVPPQYFLKITSGISNSCIQFDKNIIERDEDVITVTVWNTAPQTGEQIECTEDYRTLDHQIGLGTDFEVGKTYIVNVNDVTLEMNLEVASLEEQQPPRSTPTPAITMQQVPAPVEQAEIVITDSIPEEYFLAVTSGLPGGCVEFGGFDVLREGDVLRVTLWNLEPSQPIPCTKEYRYEKTTIPLGSDFEEGGNVYRVLLNDMELELVTVGGRTPIDEEPGVQSEVEESMGEIGENSELAIGDAVTFGESGPKIQFLEVMQDTRCVTGSECLEPGLVVALFGVSIVGGFPMIYELTLSPLDLEGSSVIYGAFTITLLRIEPQPNPDSKILASDYEVTLLVNAQ